MHIGINTVDMNGKGFKKIVQNGQRVKKGDELIEFDIREIKDAGYDTTTMMIISNTDDCKEIVPLTSGKVTVNSDLMKVMRASYA